MHAYQLLNFDQYFLVSVLDAAVSSWIYLKSPRTWFCVNRGNSVLKYMYLQWKFHRSIRLKLGVFE